MEGYEERKIHLSFTPKELRSLADKMEKDAPNLLAGASTCIEAKTIQQGVMVLIHISQDYLMNVDTPKE